MVDKVCVSWARAYVISKEKKNRAPIGVPLAIQHKMGTTALTAEELLERATALAKSERNLEIMDCATVLLGYLEKILGHSRRMWE